MKQVHYELAASIEIFFSHINSDKMLKSGEDVSELQDRFFTTDEFWDGFGEYTNASCTRNELESTIENLKFDIEYGSGLLIDKLIRQKYDGEVVSCVSTKSPNELVYVSEYNNAFLKTVFLVEIDAQYSLNKTVDLNTLFEYICNELGSFTDLNGFAGMITDTAIRLTSSD